MRSLVVLLLLSVLGLPISAATITYTFTGTADGSLSGMLFRDADLIFVTTVDLATVISADGRRQIISFNVPSASFAIGGTGSGMLQDPYVFVNRGMCSANSRFPSVSSCVGIGQAVGGDIFSVANNVFSTYDMTTSFGPAGDPTPGDQFGVTFTTSSGDLVFSAFGPGTFVAVLSGTTVPEPCSLAFSGAFALLLLMWPKDHSGSTRCQRPSV